MFRRLLLVTFCLISSFCYSRILSPLNCGLLDAKSDVERYEVLLKTHTEAAQKGEKVSYRGIKQISIEIPSTGMSIPLSYYTDFARVKLVVKNLARNMPLFVATQDVHEISIDYLELTAGSFRKHKELRKGKKLLIIEDQKRWVEQRSGYNSGATRRDILYLKQGKALNQVIASYDDGESVLKCWWCNVGKKQIVIKNLVFERMYDSKAITQLCAVSNEDNVLIRNVQVSTPDNTGLYGDALFKFENCTNVRFEDVLINGTYSLNDKYGYGIGMNNVWNVSFVRLKANGAWGVFGNNNVNTAYLEDCDINRFDIHCYGKDVYCKNTTFRDLYNQFSSLYGTLFYDNCKFIHFVPVLFESSYSAYTHFNLVMKDCEIDVDKDRPYMINAGNPSILAERPRLELSKACWPDIEIKNMTVNLPKDTDSWNIFQLRGGAGTKLYGISEIIIEGLEINGSEASSVVKLSNRKVWFEKNLDIRISNSNIDWVE